jgi:GT2 family glycosyltransferase
MTVSIIIAVKTWAKNLEECIGKCLELDFSDFEIIILPDFQEGAHPQAIANTYNSKGTVPIKVIPTGPITPPKKRDIGIIHAKGQIVAFIDDDAYPRRDWLKNALENFKDNDVAAVGGSSVTPQDDSLRQKASGLIYASPLVSGRYIYRYLPRQKLQVDDYPTCNLLVRKSVLEETGGFNTNFWPGEDTKLCLDITQGLGKKIIYNPGVLVYHHRRQVFLPHLKQVANYGLHRGYFAKRYPANSLKIAYFIPTLFLLALVAGAILSAFFTPLRILYLWGLSLYLILVFIFSISKELRLLPMIFSGIILTHITYGIYFLKGFLSSKLKEE